MTRSHNQKAKLLYMMRLFMTQTDECHSLPRKKLEEKLADYGVSAERKSIYSDIEALRFMGMDIEYRKESPEGYYLASREFELPELKLLVDAVQSSKFITEKKSAELIKKIAGLTSVHEAKQLQRQVFVSNRIKAMNESIYYNVDKLHLAVGSNQQVTFRYFNWTISKEIQLKKNGESYQVSPWALTWDDENYYLIGYDMDAAMLKHFRVDKMLDIVLLDIPRAGQEEFQRFDLAHYSKKTFGMFGGREEMLRIRFQNKFMGVVIDRFGKDISIYKEDEEHFTIRVEVAVSTQFFGWLAGLGKGALILTPKEIAQEYRELLLGIAEEIEDISRL